MALSRVVRLRLLSLLIESALNLNSPVEREVVTIATSGSEGLRATLPSFSAPRFWLSVPHRPAVSPNDNRAARKSAQNRTCSCRRRIGADETNRRDILPALVNHHADLGFRAGLPSERSRLGSPFANPDPLVEMCLSTSVLQDPRRGTSPRRCELTRHGSHHATLMSSVLRKLIFAFRLSFRRSSLER